jgi:hypothetical protein
MAQLALQQIAVEKEAKPPMRIHGRDAASSSITRKREDVPLCFCYHADL